MGETYLQKLQREHKERRVRISSAAKPLSENPVEEEEEIVLNRGRADFKDIFKEVCKYYGVSMLDVISARRDIKTVTARHVTAHIASQHTLLSTRAIASRLARDASTITHALDRMERLSKTEKVASDLAKLKEKLGL
jgi:chromosomal replication initiation ATPase DnaA